MMLFEDEEMVNSTGVCMMNQKTGGKKARWKGTLNVHTRTYEGCSTQDWKDSQTTSDIEQETGEPW